MWSMLGGAGSPMLPATRRRLVCAGGVAAAAVGAGATLRARRCDTQARCCVATRAGADVATQTQRRAAERSPSGAHLRGGATGAHAARRPVAAASAHEPGARPRAVDRAASKNQGAHACKTSHGLTRWRFSAAARAEPGAVVQMIAGALAGGVARVFVAPLDVVKIRMQARLPFLGHSNPQTHHAIPAVVAVQVQLEPTRSGLGKYTGLRQAVSLIAREEGLRGLWRGTAPALLLWVPYTAIQFAALARFNEASRFLFPLFALRVRSY
jgi:hypothetical protein